MRSLRVSVLPLAALFALAACQGEAGPARTELLVSAATSTRDALLALEAEYEREHAVELVFNFGASGDLANQIVAAGTADVFLSADEKEMDKVQAAGLIDEASRRPLLSNQLVIVEPADVPSLFQEPFEARQLAQPALALLSLGDVASVPAGRYAQAWLEAQGVWSEVEARILPGVDVRAALAAVESGGAGAGIVYRTDAARATRVRVVHAVPRAEGPAISYPLALVGGRPAANEAREFVEFLRSRAAGAAFEAAGFVFLPATDG